MAHQLVIRNGTVLDGTGAEGGIADVAVDGGRITAIGAVQAHGETEIDAEGRLVTPGWVVIDFPSLSVSPPELAFDLPANGRRLLQRASGYAQTIVSGEIVMRDGEHTGALPGRLVRGTQSRPEAAL